MQATRAEKNKSELAHAERYEQTWNNRAHAWSALSFVLLLASFIWALIEVSLNQNFGTLLISIGIAAVWINVTSLRATIVSETYRVQRTIYLQAQEDE